MPAASAYSETMGPSAPVWDGPFIGGYIGGAWANSDIVTDVGPVTSTSYFVSVANANSVNQSASGKVNPSAFIGGIQAGNNWTANNLLYGLALDFGSFSLNKNIAVNNVPFPSSLGFISYSTNVSVNTDWLFTARARLGYICNSSRFMVYGTGGLALTDLKVGNIYSDSNVLTPSNLDHSQSSNKKSNKAGWTVGAGAELFVTQKLTVNAEYLYVDFNNVTTSTPIVETPKTSIMNTSANLSANIFRVGLNYKA